MQLYTEGAVRVDEGVTATLGSLIGMRDDAGFIKAGAGSLSIGTATLTGGLALQQGALSINGGTISHTTGEAVIAAAHGTRVTLSGVRVAGAEVYALAAGGRAGRFERPCVHAEWGD